MNCPMLSILKEGESCEITFCHHNMFWDGLKLNKRAQPTEASLEFSNCMALLDREMTLEEIGEMWGISRERIRQIERDATMKLLALGLNKMALLKEFDFRTDKGLIKKRLDKLRFKKYRRAEISYVGGS
jgi:hypothetical protein